MPRRQAAQSAASKISNTENEEEPVSSKRTTRGRPGKLAGKPNQPQKLGAGNALQGKENVCEKTDFKKSMEETNTEQKQTTSKQRSTDRKPNSKKKGKGYSDAKENTQDSVIHDEDIVLALNNDSNLNREDEGPKKKEEALAKRVGIRGRKKKADHRNKIQQAEITGIEQTETDHNMKLSGIAKEQVKTTADVPHKRRGKKTEDDTENGPINAELAEPDLSMLQTTSNKESHIEEKKIGHSTNRKKPKSRKKGADNTEETTSDQKDATFTVAEKSDPHFKGVEHKDDNDTTVNNKTTKKKAKVQTKAIEQNGENSTGDKESVWNIDTEEANVTKDGGNSGETNTGMKVKDRKKGIKKLEGGSKTKKIEEDLQAVRSQISQWWEKCYFGAKQRKLFLPYFDDTLTMSNLSAHKKEETRLRKYYEKNRAVFESISMHYSEDDLKQRPYDIENDYQMKLREKDKEFLDYQALQREIMKELETQVQAKEQRIKQVEENIQEMKVQQSKIQAQAEQKMEQMKNEVKETKTQVDQKSEQRENEFQEMKELLRKKDEIIKGLRKSLEETRKTYPKEDSFIKTSEHHSISENMHEINVLHEFCQKQKKTIRTLQREIEHLRKVKNEPNK